MKGDRQKERLAELNRLADNLTAKAEVERRRAQDRTRHRKNRKVHKTPISRYVRKVRGKLKKGEGVYDIALFLRSRCQLSLPPRLAEQVGAGLGDKYNPEPQKIARPYGHKGTSKDITREPRYRALCRVVMARCEERLVSNIV